LPDAARLAAASLLPFVAALAVTPVAIAVAHRTRFYDHPRGYKGHAAPTPYLGGTAVMAGFLAGALAFGGGVTSYAPIVGGALVLWLVGTLDDRRTVPPSHRIVIVAFVAVLLWTADVGWRLFESDAANVALTVAWLVAAVNAFNLMDNMDGAAPTVGAASALGAAGLAAGESRLVLAALAVALAAACLGFLRYNLADPARIFLGDGGSMAIGLVVAATVMAMPRGDRPGWEFLVPAMLVVGLPAFDTALVIVSRFRRRVTIWAGGRDHITHRLHKRLGSPRKVAAALGGAQLALGGLALLAASLSGPEVAALGAACLAAALVGLVVFESDGWRPEWLQRDGAGRIRVVSADAPALRDDGLIG
jgi:UDP-GlcNAc:undecaprenyl-phosphate/decaprenyl-phosphate GlcNAc-1-phosphate transferase